MKIQVMDQKNQQSIKQPLHPTMYRLVPNFDHKIKIHSKYKRKKYMYEDLLLIHSFISASFRPSFPFLTVYCLLLIAPFSHSLSLPNVYGSSKIHTQSAQKKMRIKILKWEFIQEWRNWIRNFWTSYGLDVVKDGLTMEKKNLTSFVNAM